MSSSIPNDEHLSRTPSALSRRLKSSAAVIGLAALLSAGSLVAPWSDLTLSPAHATGGGSGGGEGGDGGGDPGDGGGDPGDGGGDPGDGGGDPGDGGGDPGDGGGDPGDGGGDPGDGAEADGNAGSEADLAANDTDWPFNDPLAQQDIEERLAQDPTPAPDYAPGTVGNARYWSPSVPPVGWAPAPGCDAREEGWHLDCQVENLMQRLSEIER